MSDSYSVRQHHFDPKDTAEKNAKPAALKFLSVALPRTIFTKSSAPNSKLIQLQAELAALKEQTARKPDPSPKKLAGF